MRPLPNLQQSRAALLSICAHGGLLVLLLLVGREEGSAPSATIIEAELIALAPSRPPEPAAAPLVPEADLLASESPPPSGTQPTHRPPQPNTVANDSPPPALTPATVQTEGGADAESAATAEPTLESQAPEPSTPDPATVVASAPVVPPAEAAATEAPAPSAEQPGAAPVEPHVAAAVRRRLASWTGRLTPEKPEPTLEWREDGQPFTAVLTKLPAGDPMAMEQLRVEVTTERDGERLATELRMTRVAFSSFAQFIDRWDPNVGLQDDVIDGRFHSNTEFLVSRESGVSPVFNGRVTLAATDFASDGRGFANRQTMFPAGIETNVRRIVMPARAAALETAAIPTERSHHLERDAALTFNADGSYDWRHVDGSGQGRRGLDDEPFYVIAVDDASLEVRGTVNGKVLVYSPRHIVVTDDLRYADDPRVPGATDYLGLVAERTVDIAEPKVTGPGDLEIHASIYARQIFQVRSYSSPRDGTLRVVGSVTAGTLSATEPRFATKIEFDDRLTTMRAPGFPLSDRYELDSWSGEWRVLSAE